MSDEQRRHEVTAAARKLDCCAQRLSDLVGRLVPAQLAGGLTKPLDEIGDALARVAALYADLGRAVAGEEK